MKRKERVWETRSGLDTLPMEIVQCIGTFLHPWEYVQMCIALNRRPDPRFLWKYFKVDLKDAKNRRCRRYPFEMTLSRRIHGAWKMVYSESVICLSWHLPEGNDSQRKSPSISYVQRTGQGRQWWTKDGEQLIVTCNQPYDDVQEKHYFSVLDAFFPEWRNFFDPS